MKLKAFVDDIAKNPTKGLVWAILLLLLFVLLYFAWKKVKAIYEDVKTEIDNIQDNPVNSGNLTHEGVWYKNSANTLFEAMDGWGTDWTSIESIIIQINNQDDWNKLVREYGTRTLKHTFMKDVTGTLQVHLKYDCSQSEWRWIERYLALTKNVESGL